MKQFNQRISKLLYYTRIYDNLGYIKLSDILTNNIYKYAQLEPFNIEEGIEFNDPESLLEYFMGYAFDLFNRNKNITKSQLIAEVEKKVDEKYKEIPEEFKNIYSNLSKDVIDELKYQPFWNEIEENSSDQNELYGVAFDPNSTAFENALNYMFDVEGGYSDYNPSTGDPRTNLGIIQSEYDRYRTKKNLNTQSVSNISMDEAKEIYFNDYWNKVNAEYVSQKLPKTALVLFDFAVNSGIGGASNLVSKTLNIPSTRFDSRMINSIMEIGNSLGDSVLAKNLIDRRYINYDEIIARNPRKAVYRKGWQNRLKKLDNMIDRINVV